MFLMASLGMRQVFLYSAGRAGVPEISGHCVLYFIEIRTTDEVKIRLILE